MIENIGNAVDDVLGSCNKLLKPNPFPAEVEKNIMAQMDALWATAQASGQTRELAKIMCARTAAIALASSSHLRSEKKLALDIAMISLIIHSLDKQEDALLQSLPTLPLTTVLSVLAGQPLNLKNLQLPAPLIQSDLSLTFNEASKNLLAAAGKTKSASIRENATELADFYREISEELVNKSFPKRLISAARHKLGL